MRLRLTLLLMLMLVAGRQALADELTPEKRSDIVRLLQVTGAANIAQQFSAAVAQQTFATIKKARPDVPDRVYKVMEREISSTLAEHISAPGGLLDQMVAVYDKYYTDQEIRELLTFYRSPIGRKIVSTMPSVLNESMMAGRKWGESLGPEIRIRVHDSLEREGLLRATR